MRWRDVGERLERRRRWHGTWRSRPAVRAGHVAADRGGEPGVGRRGARLRCTTAGWRRRTSRWRGSRRSGRWPAGRHADASLIWADVLGQARANARPVARYLVFMVVAGVIAAYGVIEVNSILIVGAMAVSPDMLPVAAACVGVREPPRAPRMAGARHARDRAGCDVCRGRSRSPPASTSSIFFRPDSALDDSGARRADDRQRRDRRGGARRGRRGHARARDARELGGGGGHLDNDDPGRRLLRRGAGCRRDGARRRAPLRSSAST